jgi:hypothetical protein
MPPAPERFWRLYDHSRIVGKREVMRFLPNFAVIQEKS